MASLEITLPVPREDLTRMESIRVEPITDAAEASEAADRLTFVATVRKSLEDGQKRLTDPYTGTVKKIRAVFKPLLDKAEGVERELRVAVRNWKISEDARVAAEALVLLEAQTAEAEDIRQAVAAGDVDSTQGNLMIQEAIAAPIPVASKTVAGDVGKVTLADHYVYRVVDQSKVPAKYFCLDDKAIRADIRAGIHVIDGLDIYNEPIVRTGGR